MLELGVTRWQDGHKSSINQFLLIADYLSEKTNSVKFYQMGVGGDVHVEAVSLGRNDKGQIEWIESDGSRIEFEYDGRLVQTLRVVR